MVILRTPPPSRPPARRPPSRTGPRRPAAPITNRRRRLLPKSRSPWTRPRPRSSVRRPCSRSRPRSSSRAASPVAFFPALCPKSDWQVVCSRRIELVLFTRRFVSQSWREHRAQTTYNGIQRRRTRFKSVGFCVLVSYRPLGQGDKSQRRLDVARLLSEESRSCGDSPSNRAARARSH